MAPRRAVISIHAPLAGRDSAAVPRVHPDADFNPRAPRGARPVKYKDERPALAFQSTRPSRGVTGLSLRWSPPLPISIHAPLAGRDELTIVVLEDIFKFQSTRPSRGATVLILLGLSAEVISIHAPLAGRDKSRGRKEPIFCYFNPRAPRGARLIVVAVVCFNAISIHAPLAGRDAAAKRAAHERSISIHAPLAGRDDVNLVTP